MTTLLTTIGEFSEANKTRRDNWVARNVLPRLQYLIDKAQAKINRGLQFMSGNGMSSMYLTPSHIRSEPVKHSTDWKFNDSVSQTMDCILQSGPIQLRYRDRFPELVEFFDIVCALEEELDYTTDDITPSNFKGG